MRSSASLAVTHVKTRKEMLICRCDVSNCLLWKATNDTDHNDQSKNNDPFLFA